MSVKVQERIAILIVVMTLVGLPLAVYLYDRNLLASRNRGADKVFELTGVHDVGMWTTQNVSGWNYWWRKVQPTPPLEVNQGDRVLIRLRSADVNHSFSIPQLKIGPVQVEAGHMEEVRFTAERAGRFRFLCYTVCGMHHKEMKGELIVHGKPGEGGEEGPVDLEGL